MARVDWSSPIRVSPTPPTCRVLPSSRAKLRVGRCSDVAERGDPQVAEQYLPINHLVFANLKSWLNGIHLGVSHQHLQAYLNEFTFRFNRRFYPFNAFRSLLGIAGDGEVFVAVLGEAGVAAPVVGDKRRAWRNGHSTKPHSDSALRSGTMASRTRPA
jgi:hypothetical protein